MSDHLFEKFPMLDAAIVNAVAEQFTSASGQVDIAQATFALEMMLPPEYQTLKSANQVLPESICVVDPMQTVQNGHQNMSPPGPSHVRGGRHASGSAQPSNPTSAVNYLIGVFSGLDPVVVRTVIENSGGDTAAAYAVLQEMAGDDPSIATLRTQNEQSSKYSGKKPSDVSPRDYLIQRFPTVPATTIDNILAEHHHDIDASIAHLMTASGPSGGHSAAATDWFEQHQRDEEFIETLPEDEFKRKLSSLRMLLMSASGRQPENIARVVPAERIAAALHYCNCNFETAKSLLLAGGDEELPPYEYPLAIAAVEPAVQDLQQRLDQELAEDTLASILKSVDGSIDDAIAILREAGVKMKDTQPVSAAIHVSNVPQQHHPDGVRDSSPLAKRVSQMARGNISAPGSPAQRSPPPGSPMRGGVRGIACHQQRYAISRHSTPGGAAATGGSDDMRELAPKEYVWWWNSARGIWVEASVECRNARQLAVEYTLRLANAQLVDAARAHLRPRFAASPEPPPPLLTGACSPRLCPTALNPLRRGLTDAPVASPDHAASFASSPASSSPIIIDPDRSASEGGHGALKRDGRFDHGRMDTAVSNLYAQPQIETREFLEPAEQNNVRAARDVQEAQDRNLALQLASEMPPDAAALPESDDDDNIGLLSGEAQAVATQSLYERLNRPVKEITEQIQMRKERRDEARAMGNEHVRGQLTFEIQTMEAKKDKMQAEVATRMYRARNRHNREVFTLDLHGLHVDAALQTLTEKLVYASGNPSPGRTLLIVITGRGRHSAVKNFSVLRDAVGKFLNHPENQKRFNSMTVMGPGHCIVELFPKDKTPSPLSQTEFVELSNWPSVHPVLKSRGDAPDETAKRRSRAGTSAVDHQIGAPDLWAAVDSPRTGRADSAASDALSDPIPQSAREDSLGGPANLRGEPFDRGYATGHSDDGRLNAQVSDGPPLSHHTPPHVESLSPEAKLVQSLLSRAPVVNVAHSPPALVMDGPDGDPRRAGVAPARPFMGNNVLNSPTVHCPNQLVDVEQRPQGSQSRVGTTSDMSSRDLHKSVCAAMENLESEAGAHSAKQVMPELNASASSPGDRSKLHERRGVGGGCEESKQGISMLSQMLNLHVTGLTPAHGPAARGLAVTDCVGHDADPQLRNNGQDSSIHDDGLMTPDRGSPLPHAANYEEVIDDGMSTHLAGEARVEPKEESVAVRACGHEPPNGDRATAAAEDVQPVMQQPDAPASDDVGVAPLAAQLAKLYC